MNLNLVVSAFTVNFSPSEKQRKREEMLIYTLQDDLQ